MDVPLPHHKIGIRSPQLERAAAFMGKVGNTLRRRKKKSSGGSVSGEELDRDGSTTLCGEDDSDHSDSDGGGVAGQRSDRSPQLQRRRAATGPELSSPMADQPTDCCGVSRNQNLTSLDSSSPSSSGSHALSTLTPPPSRRKLRGAQISGVGIWTGIKATLGGAGARRRQGAARKPRVPSDDRLSASQPDIRPGDADEDDEEGVPNGNGLDSATLATEASTDSSKRSEGQRQKAGKKGKNLVPTDEASFSSPDKMMRKKKSEAILKEMQMDSSFADDEDVGAVGGMQVIDSTEATMQRERLQRLRQYPFFQLEVTLKSGHDLLAKDLCGTSDPYVKFKCDGKQLYRSRIINKNLNPVWDESFDFAIEDVFKPITVKAYDYDWGANDDFIGQSMIDLSQLDLNTPTQIRLDLYDPKNSRADVYMGYILLDVELKPKTISEKELYARRASSKVSDQVKQMKMQIWSSVVTIVLMEGWNLLPMDDNGLSDPYCKFTLGKEKYKSKVKRGTLNPKWTEQFDLHIFEDQSKALEMVVYDHDYAGKDDFMGRASIDLSLFEPERTHNVEQELEDGAGVIRLLLTISGSSGSETISDLKTFDPDPNLKIAIQEKYNLWNSFRDMPNVGWVQIKVIQAQGLMAADIGGKSDPFVILQLVNCRLQTQTEYKTICPQWQKVFTLQVKDIHSALEFEVFDEDRNKPPEFLGKVAIPLLTIRPGEKKWYQLKDRKLMSRAKGCIQLEMDLVFSPVKACLCTIKPKEEKFMVDEKRFRINLMKRNINRIHGIALAFYETGRFITSCFSWESKVRSATAFFVFLLTVWNFELYMLPLTLLVIFGKNYFIYCVSQHYKDLDTQSEGDAVLSEQGSFDEEGDDDDEEKSEKEGKRTFKEKLQAVQDICLTVQEAMDEIASLGERIKNTFNWTVPFMSTFAVVILSVVATLLYFVPCRVIILLWGCNKFTKRLRNPENYIDNNELMDFLSRVPSDVELSEFRELRPDYAQVLGTKQRKSR